MQGCYISELNQYVDEDSEQFFMRAVCRIETGEKTVDEIREGFIPVAEPFDIKWELMVLSAHRNPDKVGSFAKNARSNGYGCLVAGAGMAAHLGGMLKAHSTLPVIGVPMPGGICWCP